MEILKHASSLLLLCCMQLGPQVDHCSARPLTVDAVRLSSRGSYADGGIGEEKKGATCRADIDRKILAKFS